MFNVDVAGGGAGGNYYLSMGYQFSLQHIPGLTEFTSLFDYYSIRKVVIKIIPCYNVGSVGNAGSLLITAPPMLAWSIDHDDNVPLSADITGMDELRTRHNFKRSRMYKPVTIVIKPRVLLVSSQQSEGPGIYTQTPSTIVRPRRLDMARTHVPHFGLKMMWHGLLTGSPATYSFRAETTYYLKLSGPR